MAIASGMDLLPHFPLPAAIVDGALEVLQYSQRLLPVLGLRVRPGATGEQMRLRVGAALSEDPELGDWLALATARLTAVGDEEHLTWEHGERRFTVTASPIGGSATALLVLFEDITARSRSEQALLDVRLFLESILNDLPVGVIVLSRALRITAVNRQQLAFLQRMGIELDLVDTIGAALSALLPQELGAAWHGLCAEVERTGERVVEARKQYPVADGELVLSTVAAPLSDQQGQRTGVILVSENVSEQSRLERELVRAEKLATVGQMVITINHEINNPLSIISTNAQMVRLLNPELDAGILAKLKKIEAQVGRISEVTERLRRMDEVATSAYIASGPEMIDVWRGEAS